MSSQKSKPKSHLLSLTNNIVPSHFASPSKLRYTSLSTKYIHLKHTYPVKSSISSTKPWLSLQHSIYIFFLRKSTKIVHPPPKLRCNSVRRRYNHLKHTFLVQQPSMAFISRFHLGVFLFFILTPFTISFILSPSPQPEPEPEPTLYDILPIYGLPRGIFPDSVESYNLDKDGNFEVFLKAPCYVNFEYLVYYAEKISGKLGIGSITELKGIKVKRFLFWFNVKEIRVDLPVSDSVYFQIGLINKKLDINQFETIHSCMENGFLLLSSCGGSLRQALQLPAPVNEMQMLTSE